MVGLVIQSTTNNQLMFKDTRLMLAKLDDYKDLLRA